MPNSFKGRRFLSIVGYRPMRRKLEKLIISWPKQYAYEKTGDRRSSTRIGIRLMAMRSKILRTLRSCPDSVDYPQVKYLNNQIEADHGAIKRCSRSMLSIVRKNSDSAPAAPDRPSTSNTPAAPRRRSESARASIRLLAVQNSTRGAPSTVICFGTGFRDCQAQRLQALNPSSKTHPIRHGGAIFL